MRRLLAIILLFGGAALLLTRAEPLAPTVVLETPVDVVGRATALVVVARDHANRVAASMKAYDTRVAGVVSDKPGGFSMKTGHFTQVVWRGTTAVGCGRSQCNGLDVWICQYDPPGNVEGQYRDNVRPTGCR